MTPSELALSMMAVIPKGSDTGLVVGALAIGHRMALDSAVRNGVDREEYKRFILDGVKTILDAELPSQRAAKMN